MNKRTIFGVGFIGFQLMKDIVKIMEADDVLYVVDNDRLNLRRAIEYLMDIPMYKGQIHIVYGDAKNLDGAHELYPSKGSISTFGLIKDAVVFNLSARVGVKSWTENPYQNYRENYAIDDNLYEVIRHIHCKHYVYASSSEVYGNSVNDEGSLPTDNLQISSEPRGLYSLEKLHGEFLTKTAGVPFTICRFFNIIGPYQDVSKGVFPKFVEKLKKGEEIKASSDIRCFCDVRDCTGAILALVNESSGTYNICNPNNEISMSDLAEFMKYYLESSSEITNTGSGFISKRIGYDNVKPFYNHRYTIKDTLDYYMEEVNER